MIARFTIAGEPLGKGRPRFVGRNGYVKAVTPDRTANYETLVKFEYSAQCGAQLFPQGVPLDLSIMAFYSIPKSVSQKKRALMLEQKIRPTKKPDWDNIGKVISDSLNKIAYYDDSQIVDSQVRKFYSDTPRVEVILQEAQ